MGIGGLYRPHWGGSPRPLEAPPNEGLTRCDGTTKPTDGSAGYAHGCTWRDKDGTTAADTLYINIGSNTSCNFDLIVTSTDGIAMTSTVAELNTLHTQTLTTGAGAGFTGGTGTIYKNSVWLNGGIYTTRILFDLTGLDSKTTDEDIIGLSTGGAAHLGQITAAQNGTILGGTMVCLEAPTGGVADINLWWATEATGAFDDAISGLTETVLIQAGGSWTIALTKAIADPVGIANGYLYLTSGAAGTSATYTAGKFLLTLWGY